MTHAPPAVEIFFVLSKINLVRKTNALFVVCLCTGMVGIMLTVWTSTGTFPNSLTILRPTASRNSGITHAHRGPKCLILFSRLQELRYYPPRGLQVSSSFLDSRSSGITHLAALWGWSSFLDSRSSGIIHLEALQVSSSFLDSRSSGITHLEALQVSSSFLDSRSSGITHLEALWGWSSFLDSRSSWQRLFYRSSHLEHLKLRCFPPVKVLTEAVILILWKAVIPASRSWDTLLRSHL